MAQKIEIVFLGTGSHTPTARRNHTGVLLNYGAESMLFDCGEGIQRQFKIAKLNPCRLTRIFITHWHGDHALGIPGLLYTLKSSDYNNELHIYGPKGTERNLQLVEEIYHKIRINSEAHEIHSGVCVNDKEFQVTALPMEHGIATLAYTFEIKEKRRLDKKKIEKLKLPNSPLIGKLQRGETIEFKGKKITADSISYVEQGRKVAFIMDTAMNPNTLTIAKDADILICESTFGSDEKEKAREYKHLTATDAATIAKQANVKKLILTHISHRYDTRYQVILKEAKQIFKNTVLANDFDRIEL